MKALPASESRICGRCGRRTPETICGIDGSPTYSRATADTADLRMEPGAVLADKYRIVGRIGRGGFAAVYSAQHLATAQMVAIKVLTVDAEDDDTILLRFLQEAQVTARLRHPNTVRVYDFGQTKTGSLYMVLELLHGPTLEAVLRDHANRGSSMGEREAVGVVIPVLRALAEAHDAGLIHRDLKPHNIILADTGDEEPTVKVLDFGVARVADSNLTGTGKALGTPAYMSPEQCLGLPLDARSDLYSVGVMLFRMVAGRPPYESDNVMRLLQMHAHDEVPDLRVAAKRPVSDGVADLVAKAMAKVPEQRYANAREMRAACEMLVGGASPGTPLEVLVGGSSNATNGHAATMALDVDPTTAATIAAPAAPAAKTTSAGTQAEAHGAGFGSKRASRILAWLAAVAACVGGALWVAGRASEPEAPLQPDRAVISSRSQGPAQARFIGPAASPMGPATPAESHVLVPAPVSPSDQPALTATSNSAPSPPPSLAPATPRSPKAKHRKQETERLEID